MTHADPIHVFELCAALVGFLATGWATFIVAVRFGRHCFRAWDAIQRLHVEFGENPIDKLASIIKDIEASAGEIEIRQRLAERHLKIGVYVCSADGGWTWCNDWLRETMGLDSDQVEGWGWLSSIAGLEERKRVHDNLAQAIKDNVPYEDSFVVRNLRTNTESKIYSETWPVRNRDKQVVCFVGYALTSDE